MSQEDNKCNSSQQESTSPDMVSNVSFVFFNYHISSAPRFNEDADEEASQKQASMPRGAKKACSLTLCETNNESRPNSV